MNSHNQKNKNKAIWEAIKRSLFIGLALLLAFSFISCSQDNSPGKPSQSRARKNEITTKTLKKFIMIACPNPQNSVSFIKFNNLSHYLEKSTGFTIELFVPKNFKEFKNKIKNQEVDFLYVDPVLYLEIENFINKNYIYARLSGLEGELKNKPFETACIIARADSMIKTIEDVKGKKVIFGPQKSATKWIAARKLFMDNGIDIEKDLAEYRFVNKCKDIALDIFYQKADVGCIRTFVCPICENSIFYKKCGLDTSQLVHIAQTAPVNTRVFACTNRIDDKDIEKIATALLRIPELDLQKKQRLNSDLRYGFIKVDDNQFDKLRKMID